MQRKARAKRKDGLEHRPRISRVDAVEPVWGRGWLELFYFARVLPQRDHERVSVQQDWPVELCSQRSMRACANGSAGKKDVMRINLHWGVIGLGSC